MRLTNRTNYAIRILMYCSTKGRIASVSEIAEFYRLPHPFLLKIAKALINKGFLVAHRGRNGGVSLAREAKDISLGEVVRSTETNFELAECFGEGETDCPLVATCGLNATLNGALDAFFKVLDKQSIADLATPKHNIGVLQQLHVAKNAPLVAS
ncbi:MAG: Rrf2 family transcriptional regulator [Pseudomonadota bacterium]